MIDFVAPQSRRRLTHACSECRARKIRCDERIPTCSNCARNGRQCITIDLRRPQRNAERRRTIGKESPINRPSPSPVSDPVSDTVVDTTDVQDKRAREPLPTLPRFLAGSGLSILAQWLKMAFQRLGVPHQMVSSNASNVHRLTSLLIQPPQSRRYLEIGLRMSTKRFLPHTEKRLGVFCRSPFPKLDL